MRQESAIQGIFVTKEEIAQMNQLAAEIGAKTALDKLEQEKRNFKEKAKNKKLHNTKLLLRNYKMLKENAENSIFGKSQMEESAADVLSSMMNLYDDEVIIDAIKRSATRTAIMVAHLEAMLNVYDLYCRKSSNDLEKRRYLVLYDLYINEQPLLAKDIAKIQNRSKESVYSDLKMAIERLSSLVFGIDSLR